MIKKHYICKLLCFHKIEFLDSNLEMSEDAELRNDMEKCVSESVQKSIPRHVAVIMDGNGRWAQKRGLERMQGHVAGVESLRNTIKEARISGVEYLTVYAFSTENWGRPEKEVDGLMNLFCKCLEQESTELNKQGVRLMFIGQRNGLNEEIRKSMDSCEKLTVANDKLTLIVAFNYSARQELIDVARMLATDVAEGTINVEDIDEQQFEQKLYTRQIPAPDLIIRTSGECRLSNFLLWQAAYAEFYFTQVLWPDFDSSEWQQAMTSYGQRKRRFGLV